jgi:hypothetical protein
MKLTKPQQALLRRVADAGADGLWDGLIINGAQSACLHKMRGPGLVIYRRFGLTSWRFFLTEYGLDKLAAAEAAR